MEEQDLWWTTGRNGSSPSGFSGPSWLLHHKLQILEDLLSRPRPQPTDITMQDAPLEELAPGDEPVPGDAVTEDGQLRQSIAWHDYLTGLPCIEMPEGARQLMLRMEPPAEMGIDVFIGPDMGPLEDF